MSKNIKNDPCIYCLKKNASTGQGDHAVAKMFFDLSKPNNLLTAPSCDECNKAFRDDERYFKERLICVNGKDNDIVCKHIANMLKQYKKNKDKPFVKEFRDSMKRLSLFTKSGIYCGNAGTMDISKKKQDRILEKTIRNLYYNNFKEILPKKAYVFAAPAEAYTEFPNDILSKLGPEQFLQKGAFSYRCAKGADQPYLSFWWFEYFEKMQFVGATMQHKPLDCKEKPSGKIFVAGYYGRLITFDQ